MLLGYSSTGRIALGWDVQYLTMRKKVKCLFYKLGAANGTGGNIFK